MTVVEVDIADTATVAGPRPPVLQRLTARASGPRRLAAALGAYVGAVVCFSLVVAAKRQDPITVWRAMIHSTLLQGSSLEEIVMRAVPISLAALAVAVPARAGLVNVGGEGQLILGAVAATGVRVANGAAVPGPVAWLLMALGGMAAGAMWAGLAGTLRGFLGVNEAVTTLLLNFVANDVMLYLIYQPWKDPHGSGQPQSRALVHQAQLPSLFGSQLDVSVVVTLVVAVAVWWLLRRSHWGFALRVVGGNPEAARRAGLPVSRLMASSMIVGGALAGLGGMLNLAGLELRLRPDITLTFGYVAFLASWLGRHHPAKVVGAAVLFSAIALSGNGVQLTTGLDGATVDVLLALIVAAPLYLTRRRVAA
ncbi:MAG: ABC transporter permease [Acidimicrobiales bacterium]